MSRFPTTSWSMVVAASGHQVGEARDGLAALCQAYWFPIYEYVRNQGYGAEDAQDLTQEFFVRLIEKDYVSQADRERGRFRSFLLGAMKHFLSAENRRAHAQKRGGWATGFPLEIDTAESRYRLQSPNELRPDRIFERRWALTVLDCAIESLRGAKHFEQLKPFLTGGEPGIAYCRLAAELGMSEGAVKVAIHRLRRRFAHSLRKEIARTVVSPQQIEEEIRYLLAAIQC